MTIVIFLVALALSVLTFEPLTSLQRASVIFGANRLSNLGNTAAPGRSTWDTLLVERMKVDDFGKAIEVTRAHLPDGRDVEVNLFLCDVQDFFENNRPILSSVQGLQEAVHRSVVELTESRAAFVRQRAGLFGVLAVVGLILAIIAPFTLTLA